MLRKIEHWQTEDGTVFDTQQEAEEHEAYCAKIELIEHALEVDCDAAIAIESFIREYTTGWKNTTTL